MTFKNVSYMKNKTHELRVAKIQKSKEDAEHKAAKGWHQRIKFRDMVIPLIMFVNHVCFGHLL